MSFDAIPPEILENIVSYLDITSALAFIQVNTHVNRTFQQSKRFWTDVAKYIGLEAKKSDSVDGIKQRFIFSKSGTNFTQSDKTKSKLIFKVL